ncbi:hypothetical protein GCM10007049_35090 [Echinicola pacifica]|uniref:DUF218 domain-containing protein n=1 Tax=Echinicola pacifica TaxID=346377 RepID=A0A918QAE1_9BACT|nr:YdcF family protein [Echinicola pacifica]GGZ38870.1 hypothetical protein GCM10007049_35090 [Echinicola pacifica]
MFFILAKLLTFLAMPLTWVFIGLGLALYVKKAELRKRLLWTTFTVLYLFSNQYLSNQVMKSWEPDFTPMDQLAQYEVGIVLTGVTNLNKTAYDRTFFNKGADRVTHAIQLYHLGKIKKILVTGGQGLNPANTNTEAKLLSDVMIFSGVKKEDIILETAAQNTYQNATLTKSTLEAEDIDSKSGLLLITSAFHMKRAKACFDKAGLETTIFPVDYYATDSGLNFLNGFVPDPDSIVIWHKLFKEWIGITVYRLMGYI